MDKDRVKGTLDDAAGRVKRQAGEWTGDTKAQVEGAAQQIKGKDPMPLSEGRHQEHKIQGAAAQPVHQHQRLTLASDEVMDAVGAELRVAALDAAEPKRGGGDGL